MNRREFAGDCTRGPGAGTRRRRPPRVDRPRGRRRPGCRRRAEPQRARQRAGRRDPRAVRRPAQRNRPRRRSRRQIESGLERAEKVRKVVLANGDEPDFVFSAVRSEAPGERSHLADHPRARRGCCGRGRFLRRAGEALPRPAGAAGTDLQRGGDGAAGAALAEARRARRGAGGGEGPRAAARHSRTAPRTCSPPKARRRPGAPSRTATRCSRATPRWSAGFGDAGAVLCAKLAMVELAGGMGYNQAFASFTGPGRTPWDPARWSGGSSSGSGAAVGAGLVPFAIGSETWGSIQYPGRLLRRDRPASHLRPGEPPRRHGAELDDGQARSAGADGGGLRAGARRRRRARSRGSVRPGPSGSPTAAARGHAALPARHPARHAGQDPAGGAPQLRGRRSRCCGSSADVEDELELPDYPLRGDGVHRDRRRGGERVRAALPERADHRAHRARGSGRRVRRPGRAGQGLPPRPPAAAPAAAALDRLLARVDAVAAPTLPTVAWPIDAAFDKVYPDYPGRGQYQRSGQPCGVPGLFLMNGTGEAGLPTSLQLTGRALGEDSLLAIGHRYQQRTKFHRLRPPGL